MSAILFILLILGGTALLSWPLGAAMQWAMDPPADSGPLRQRLDRMFLAAGGAPSAQPQDWKRYLVAMLVFNLVMFMVSFTFMALQQHLPLNPDGKG
ncbi:MAG: potassium-transporting ATPase subunit KdpA, partial [Candidatus Eremiobacteraeota bacterium]|nr:potassium-transporting ATPase subunit KdpA [Candidatus Eremiobacteraeota bacterium]